jgi:hypothetical protein
MCHFITGNKYKHLKLNWIYYDKIPLLNIYNNKHLVTFIQQGTFDFIVNYFWLSNQYLYFKCKLSLWMCFFLFIFSFTVMSWNMSWNMFYFQLKAMKYQHIWFHLSYDLYYNFWKWQTLQRKYWNFNIFQNDISFVISVSLVRIRAWSNNSSMTVALSS